MKQRYIKEAHELCTPIFIYGNQQFKQRHMYVVVIVIDHTYSIEKADCMV